MEKIDLDYDGSYIVKTVREAYETRKLSEDVCFQLAEIDHTIEGTISQQETINFYKLLKNDRT